MTVAQLAEHLTSLARLLESSGARGAAADVVALCDSLSPFRDQSLPAFAASLSHREPPPAEPRRPAPRPAARPTTDVEPLAREVQHTYESAASPQVTPESIDALILRLAPLTKDGLVTVAERIGLKGMGTRSKPAIQTAIRDRIEKRKGVITRASMTDRL